MTLVKKIWLTAILVFAGACTRSPAHQPLSSPTATTQIEAVALGRTPASSPVQATDPAPTAAATATRATSTPTGRPQPSNTLAPEPTATSAYMLGSKPAGTPGNILVAGGTYESLFLFEVDSQGRARRLGQLSAKDASWTPMHMSPSGEWLAEFEQRVGVADRIHLHNLYSGETQTVSIAPIGAIATVPIFDSSSSRVAYTLIDLGSRVSGTYAWVIYVRDLASQTETGFGGTRLTQPSDEPLPGAPLGWTGNDLLIDTTVPYAEGFSRGIWAIATDRYSRGETVALQRYDRLVLSAGQFPGGMYWAPTLSPDGDRIAFLIADFDHAPPCQTEPGEWGTISALGVVSSMGGAIRVLVDETGAMGALGTPLAWSPDGEQLAFAHANCDDESEPLRTTLRTIDMQGNVTGDWDSAYSGSLWWGQASWCTPDVVFYLHERGEIWRLDLTSGVTNQVLRADQTRLIGCFADGRGP